MYVNNGKVVVIQLLLNLEGGISGRNYLVLISWDRFQSTVLKLIHRNMAILGYGVAARVLKASTTG